MEKSRLHHERASLRLIKEKLECSNCDSQQRCLDTWRDQKTMRALNAVTLSKGPCTNGDFIYKMEDQFKSLYIIQSGVIKLEKPLEDGNSHISGFFFPGDIIGLESAGAKKYSFDAIALEQAWFARCRTNY